MSRPYNLLHQGEKPATFGRDLPDPQLLRAKSLNQLENQKVRPPRGTFWSKRTLITAFVFVFLVLTSTMSYTRGHTFNNEIPEESPSSTSIPYRPGQLSYSFDFTEQDESSNFKFLQSIKQDQPVHSGQNIQVLGGVILKAALSDAPMVTVDLAVELSHEDLGDSISISKTSHTLDFETDTIAPGHRDDRPWIKVIATISVRSDLTGPLFSISTVQLPVELQDSLRLTAEALHITTVSGKVACNADTLESRRIRVETTSGPISGTYPLADLLLLKSVSGTVTVQIEPEESGSKEKDGELVIETRSGSIRVDTRTSSIPDRRFSISVLSTSGTVSGSYLLGFDTKISSGSGSLNVDLHAAGSVSDRTLDLHATSGTINVEILDRGYELKKLSSEVHSMSGTVTVNLPKSWNGKFSFESMSGTLRATGRDVKITDRSGAFPAFSKSLKGSRGDGSSYLHIKTMSGTISADFA